MRYPALPGVKRSVCWPRSKRFCCPSAPSSNSKRIKLPSTEIFPMGLPGTSRSWARAEASGTRTAQSISSAFRKRQLSLVTIVTSTAHCIVYNIQSRFRVHFARSVRPSAMTHLAVLAGSHSPGRASDKERAVPTPRTQVPTPPWNVCPPSAGASKSGT